ncbi:hypothetical protein [Paenibacillus tepidiphilus]|uniref:hypothetical protein n=1 Tax=Paenibacillus tepidiphilus TaxID=2608683 RepID=UPI0013A57643|nr:hypothetical protein [Paenibacillus tepidiphilus]
MKDKMQQLLLALSPLIFIYALTLAFHTATFIVQTLEALATDSYGIGYAFGSFLEKTF